jgi:hypothetical protein
MRKLLLLSFLLIGCSHQTEIRPTETVALKESLYACNAPPYDVHFKILAVSSYGATKVVDVIMKKLDLKPHFVECIPAE